MFWDGEQRPSVEVPLGDFFCQAWGVRCNIASLAIAVNPAGGFNSYWEMPFRKSALITVENLGPEDIPGFYYQITYALTDVPEEPIFTHSGGEQIRYPTKRPIRSLMECRDTDITSELTWPGAFTTPAGGAKERSNTTWTATLNGRPSAAPEQSTILAGPGTMNIPKENMASSLGRTQVCPW
jgi:hypothetical protein